MTTPWKPSRIWDGMTVAVLCSSAGMSEAVAQALKDHACLVVNEAHRVAPWAEALIALDGNWSPAYRGFAGMRFCGIEDDTLDAFYLGHVSQTVELAPGNIVSIRNSGLAAVRLAAQLGASRIILAGFDPLTPGHFYDDVHEEYIGVPEGMAQLVAELRDAGVAVERFEMEEADVE